MSLINSRFTFTGALLCCYFLLVLLIQQQVVSGLPQIADVNQYPTLRNVLQWTAAQRAPLYSSGLLLQPSPSGNRFSTVRLPNGMSHGFGSMMGMHPGLNYAHAAASHAALGHHLNVAASLSGHHPMMNPMLGGYHPMMNPMLGGYHPMMNPMLGGYHPMMNPMLGDYHSMMNPMLGGSHPMMNPMLGDYHSMMNPMLGDYHSMMNPMLGDYHSMMNPMLGHYHSMMNPMLGAYHPMVNPMLAGHHSMMTNPVMLNNPYMNSIHHHVAAAARFGAMPGMGFHGYGMDSHAIRSQYYQNALAASGGVMPIEHHFLNPALGLYGAARDPLTNSMVHPLANALIQPPDGYPLHPMNHPLANLPGSPHLPIGASHLAPALQNSVGIYSENPQVTVAQPQPGYHVAHPIVHTSSQPYVAGVNEVSGSGMVRSRTAHRQHHSATTVAYSGSQSDIAV